MKCAGYWLTEQSVPKRLTHFNLGVGSVITFFGDGNVDDLLLVLLPRNENEETGERHDTHDTNAGRERTDEDRSGAEVANKFT